MNIYYQNGINGRGQCAAIADTGLDPESCWFKDYNVKVPYESLLSDHRKIVSYLKYTTENQFEYIYTNYSKRHKHGTYVAGLIAGQALCRDYKKKYCSGSFYNGVAPNSRLFIQEVMSEDNGKLEFSENME